MQGVRVGNIELAPLSDGVIEFQASRLFPRVTEKQWEPYRDVLTPGKDVRLVVGCFLLRSRGKTILVDSGVGPGPVAAFGGVKGRLPRELRAAGVGPDDIDIVFITHLHSDHVGWNMAVRDGKRAPYFSRAQYWVSKTDWDHFHGPEFTRPKEYLAETTTPLLEQGRVTFVEGEKALTDEITTLPAPGHTPGHTGLALLSGKERGLVLGDALHVMPQLSETDWEEAGDTDPALAVSTRKKLLERAAREKAVVAVSHFMSENIGRVSKSARGYAWMPLEAGPRKRP
ncbi:MAG: MBL fold metallo-hydrolase [SAR202 cluster bacterium]|nr:MBL fold metallo-hydrolase [SAR202 cluster bacterium]